MGGCNERYDDNRTPQQKARDTRLERAKESKGKKQADFLLELKQLFLSQKPIPNFLGVWDRLSKGPKIDTKEFEELKQRIATHHTPVISMNVNMMRRLLQTLEAKLLDQGAGIIKELPRVGKKLIVASSGDDDFPGVVVAHLPQGTVIAYEPGNPHGDGRTPGKMHVYCGLLDDLDIDSLLHTLRQKA